ncbi:MAG: hypothetical protein M3Z20_05660 [Chloroflexota bacterium]|nr:hypothetical protein [Chloroflexota bacterium]
MDAHHFDHLTRALTSAGSRRGLLGLLATVPLLGGLLAFLAPEETAAKDRRRRRKQRHKKRKDKSKGKPKRNGKQGCKPKKKATVCAGKCGAVKSRQTCGKTVDCGSCNCSPACTECFTCQGNAGAPGTCVPQAGAPCGEAATCMDGVLQPRGACDGSGVCQPAGPVSCTPNLHCAGNACASSCSDDLDCDGVCCGGACYAGICCEDDDCDAPGAPDCVGHQCVCGGNGDTPCDVGETCCEDGCFDLQTSTAHCGTCGNACGEGQVCQDGFCGVACGGDFCPATTEICVNDVCQLCDVTCTGSAAACGEALRDALEGSTPTLHVCPGTYQGGFSIDRTVTVLGAGAGQTVLDGNTTMRVLAITAAGPVTLQALTITRGADAFGGGGVHNVGDLTLIDAEVIANEVTADNSGGGGGAIISYHALTLHNTVVRGNTSKGSGGGCYIEGGSLTLEDGSSIEENTAESIGGGIDAVSSTVTLQQGSRVFKNHAGFNGGGIRIFGGIGILTLEDGSSIEENSAGGNGGGIAASSTNVTLQTGSQVTHNTADGDGGALYNTSSAVLIEDDVLICGNSEQQCGGQPVTGTCPNSATCPS